jgi:spore coat protein U-like protein
MLPAGLASMRYAIFCVMFLMAQTLSWSAQAQCAIGATTIPFGSVDLISGSTATTTGTVSISCPGGFGSFNFLWICTSIGVGVNSISVNNRTMKSGSNTLGYQLYTDSGLTTIYQYTPSNQYSAPYSNSTGGASNSTVYAKILAGQTSPPGTYTDTYSSAAQAQVAGNVATTLPGTCGGGAQSLSVSVTATVVSNCALSVANLNFGSMSTLASNADTTGSNGSNGRHAQDDERRRHRCVLAVQGQRPKFCLGQHRGYQHRCGHRHRQRADLNGFRTRAIPVRSCSRHLQRYYRRHCYVLIAI